MKRNTFKKIRQLSAGSLLCAGMILSCLTSAFAGSDYTPVSGGSMTFKKFLIVNAGTKAPAISFDFSISSGQARAAGSDSMEVLAGPGSPSVKGVTFSSGDKLYDSIQEGDIDIGRSATDRGASDSAQGVQFEKGSGDQYAVQEAEVDFSSVTFDEPGIYRYVISETSSSASAAAGVIYDNDADRILDVYVTDDGNGNLGISSYVLHTENASVAKQSEMGSADVSADGEALADKTDGFTNEYRGSDLALKMEVEGNQASRDKYFDTLLSLTGLVPGSSYIVSIADDGDPNTQDGNADSLSGSNSATITANRSKANLTELTADEKGEISAHYYLQHGQSIIVRSLPLNASYSFSENAEDYKSSESSVEGYTDSVSGSMEKNRKTSFLNERSGIIPTGIILTTLPALMLLLFCGALLFLSRRRHKEQDQAA